MAGKPELSAAPGVQNVVVYVSNDNFAQAYTVNHHEHDANTQDANVAHGVQQQHPQTPLHQNGGYPPKIYSEKVFHQQQQLHQHQQVQQLQQQQQLHLQQVQQQQLLDTQFNSVNHHFTNQAVISHQTHQNHQNHHQPQQNGYQFDSKDILHQHLHQPQETQQQGQIKDEYTNQGYVVVSDAGLQRSCDSVRSETAESSCSSLSSGSEDVLIIPNNLTETANVLVYDGNGPASGVNVRHGVVVAVGGGGGAPHTLAAAQQQLQQVQTRVAVPHGWKRIITNGVVIYISPSNTALSSLDQVKDYLLTPDTCKCGLECPLKCDQAFNFDPKVVGKAWTFTPDTNNGDLTKLCNHKRKYLQHLKDCNPMVIKKKKRKLSTIGGASVSQILAGQCEKINPKLGHGGLQIIQQQAQQPVPQPQQFITKDNLYQQPLNVAQQLQQQSQVVAQRYLTSQQALISSQQEVYQNPLHQQDGNPIEGRLNANQMDLQQPSNISHHSQQPQMRQIMASNGQVLIQAGNLVAAGQQRVFINGPPTEPSGPGRPVMIPVSIATHGQIKSEKVQGYVQQMPQGQVYQSTPPPQAVRHIIPNGYRSQIQVQHIPHSQPHVNHLQQQPHLLQKPWNRIPPNSSCLNLPVEVNQNVYEQRVPPLHQHQPQSINGQLIQGQTTPVQVQVWPDEVQRKKMKSKTKKRYEQPHNINQNSTLVHIPTEHSSPSFLEDPSGYLAQQTALLNNTINRQTGVNNYVCKNPQSTSQSGTPPAAGVLLPSNIKPYRQNPQLNHSKNLYHNPDSASGLIPAPKCTNCDHQPTPVVTNGRGSLPNQPGTRSTPGTPDPVTSSNYLEKNSPDSRPIQGGTVSTSNVSPTAVDGDDIASSGTLGSPSQDSFYLESPGNLHNQPLLPSQHQPQLQHPRMQFSANLTNGKSVVTTMASGRTVGSNTITSVLAGKTNTATVSMSNAPSGGSPLTQSQQSQQQQPTSRSPLEMVQNIVSSIKLPHSQSSTINLQGLQGVPPQVVQKGLPPGHILVSSRGQLIMASTNAQHQQPQQPQQEMPPPPPKMQSSMPPISASPIITNVTASVTQMIPAVAQQVLGQQTVLVNALPGSFVLQPGVTMTMDGMNQLQLQPQLVTGNVIQQQLQPNLLSPGKSKKGKKRKVAQPAVASMLQIAAPQNSGMVGFPQQIQMHSPQGITAAPVMQALTIVPGKAGGTPQFVMNGQMPNAAQIINSQSQPINLLQPVNLGQGMVQNFPTIQQFVLPTNLAGMVMNADGTATIVQDTNIGMQLQLQNVNGQNVLTPVQTNNQMYTVGSTNGQGILPGGMVLRPQGKIIQQQHSPGAQFLSPNGSGQFVAQFNGQLSPLVANVSPGQQVTFSPQICPTTVQQPVQQQELFACGQTLMVPANLAAATQSTSSQQNTTYVQQNTTIVQQQTTMLSNQSTNSHTHGHSNVHPVQEGSHQHHHVSQQQSVQQNVEGFMISSDKPQNIQTVLLQQRQSPLQQQINYRNSVSTQTAVNGQARSVTTFCQTNSSSTSAGSPPDTTTLSPLASGGQSPPSADTTTHSGSTDDGLSPAPSTCSSTMAMVHCISSSEPDTVELANQDLDSTTWRNGIKMEFTDINILNNHIRKTTPTRVGYAESSNMMHFASDGLHKAHENNIVSSRNLEKTKRKHSDTRIVMESRHSQSLCGDDDHHDVETKKVFVEGDLVWGPAKGCPAWPGKLMAVKHPELATVRWFGGDKILSDVDPSVLQTLTEGLDAHHRASKKSRTGRKLNTQLEKAIQEAMAELDLIASDEKQITSNISVPTRCKDQEMLKHDDEKKKLSDARKKSGRLRSSRQPQQP